jgi:cholesterol oxidase
MTFDYDYIVVGSGFGGSVAALRLAEKGYSVCVLEAGKRYRAEDFAESNWDLPKFLWLPQAACYGIQRMRFFKDVLILSGAGVGGGSLVYANTLLEPPEEFFRDPQWVDLDDDWKATLAPFYERASEMLGVVENTGFGKADEMLKDYAEELGRVDNWKPSRVGVFFGEPGVTVEDPYFDGKGPPRTGCVRQGHCMVGCKNGGKNSLDRNYLYLAEGLGVRIFPESEVTNIEPLPGGGYVVASRRTTGLWRRPRVTRTAKGVVVAAGVLGTLELLMRCRDRGTLPNLSPQLGKVIRTNSEVIAAATARNKDYDYSQGISVTSRLFVDEDTHVEVGRHPRGSDAMGLLATILVGPGSRITRPLKLVAAAIKNPLDFLKVLLPFGWAERTVSLIVMQTLDNAMELTYERRWYRPFKKVLRTYNPAGKPIPSYIEGANETAKAMAKRMDGIPRNAITEVLLGMPITVHILGGCAMAEDADRGVVDKTAKVFGYDDLYVVDGSLVSANLGVNPGLTITALAEYAMSNVPAREERPGSW